MDSNTSKFGRLTPKNWGETMPAHSPSYKKGPWFYRDTEAVIVTYLTDEEAALDILPSDLELVQPATAFMVIEFNHFSTSGGPYGEVYTGILCQYEGQVYGYTNAVYVTTENALTLGREIWGFGKKMAHRIELIRHGTGEIEAVVEVKEGQIAARALITPETNLPASVLEEIPLAVLKIIPGVEGEEPDVAKLNRVCFGGPPHKGPDGKDEVYSGEASLEVDKVSDVNLPVIQVVDAKYVRMVADLPYGETLIDYKNR
ncbi:acetoacetate decarboxylase family protein [Pseudomaricurvus alkylphenolicus]|uniref:acetoacetate decarboxylase family protein n=1 Tax=Pseudomaricurvus alkylphenolicus TaxID=1306991 RepID=UPI001421F4BD|nr:acetoacetate decarboxylase family protein [Pseudomaricurvus alkylphenolicus]NIB42251.1 acetoacetate decarboxylase family protein [Pseudomaricurvus alkylphenolicus]